MEQFPTRQNNNLIDHKVEGTRIYTPSRAIKELNVSKIIFEKRITADSKICLIGDGQGLDTAQFLSMGVKPQNIQSINYEQREVNQANREALKQTSVIMKQGDAINLNDLKNAGVVESSQDVVTLMHVLEVPNIKNSTEITLIENVAKILKRDGELLVTQYKRKFSAAEREIQKQIGIEEIAAENLQKQFGADWREKFKSEYGKDWEEGMRYGEISNIRTKEELIKLFLPYFEIKIEEAKSEYILKMKKK